MHFVTNAAFLEAVGPGGTMSGQISFVPTIDDHIAAQRLWLISYLRRRSMKLWLVLIFALLIFSIATVIVGTMAEGRSLSDSIGDVALPLTVPLVLIGLQLLAWARVPRAIRRVTQQQPNLLSETTWHWDDAGVTASSAAGTSIVRWGDLYRWLSGPTSIVLMMNERMLLIMPRRFLSDIQARNLEETLRAFSDPPNK